MLSLHDAKDDALRTILEHNGKLNACFLGSRILLEAAVSECPMVGGKVAGNLDLSRTMAKALLVHHLGGWSDGIRWGAIDAFLRITPLGDVHLDHSFLDKVYQPFGRVGAEREVRTASESYSRLFAEAELQSPIATMFETKFLDAWNAEFGISLEGMLAFCDRLDEIGQNPPRPIIGVLRSSLVQMMAEVVGISEAESSGALANLTLEPRTEWRVVSGEMSTKDWHPWRFRRRLSSLRRPFFQINTNDDPDILFAPGFVREALVATIHWFCVGEIPAQQARSAEMSKWIGHANNLQRTEFNSTVAGRMKELSWQAEPEVKLTKLLNRSFDRDYGDIDVLAWNSDSGRVLVMECKDLQYHKTIGEVAEQLSDFRGLIRPDGKRDHLRKHLDRLEMVHLYPNLIRKALKIPVALQIEGHLVFKNPVPMQFAWEQMANKIRLSLFDELDRL
jgi:hypothetical protein